MFDPFTILQFYCWSEKESSCEDFGYQFEDLIENHLTEINQNYSKVEDFSSLLSFSCFDPYWEMDLDLKTRNNFHFGFTFLPLWYEQVVNEFNRLFKNIEIEILYDKLIERSEKIATDTWYGNRRRIFYNPTDEIKKEISNSNYGYAAAFNILIKNDSYQENLRLRYVIHHFLRSMNKFENICGRRNTIKIRKDSDAFNYVLERNNLPQKDYRSLCDEDFTKEDFLALDNPEIVNKILNIEDYVCKQTGMIKLAGMFKKYPDILDVNPGELKIISTRNCRIAVGIHNNFTGNNYFYVFANYYYFTKLLDMDVFNSIKNRGERIVNLYFDERVRAEPLSKNIDLSDEKNLEILNNFAEYFLDFLYNADIIETKDLKVVIP